MTELWIATGNSKKHEELLRLLGPLGFVLRMQSEAPGAESVDEDQPDFAGNAAKKAISLAKLVQAPTVADDSGLCIDALDGRPGVHSARYAGDHATDAQRIDKVLSEMEEVPSAARSARFVCSICLADSGGRILTSIEETCEGFIAQTPSGASGFGYDPIFVARAHINDNLSFAELTHDQKDIVSHRGRALRRLVDWLANHEIQ